MARDGRNSGEVRQQSRKTGGVEAGGLAALFRQHQENAVDSLWRLLRDPLGSLLAWAVIGIALALPLSLLLLLQNLQQLGSGLDQASTLSLFVEKELEPQAVEALARQLERRDDVEAVELLSPEQALAEFQEASGFGDALAGLDENPLPPVLLVTPLGEQPQIATLQRELAALPGIEAAQVDLQWLQRLDSMVGLASRLAWLLAAMLALGAVLVIGNTVRLAIENRRSEIVVTKLVGGTDAYVARPFLYTGLWYGVGGGLLAVLLLGLVLVLLSGPAARLLDSYGSDFTLVGLGPTEAFLVLLVAGLLGWLGACVSVLRHLRSIEPR